MNERLSFLLLGTKDAYTAGRSFCAAGLLFVRTSVAVNEGSAVIVGTGLAGLVRV